MWRWRSSGDLVLVAGPAHPPHLGEPKVQVEEHLAAGDLWVASSGREEVALVLGVGLGLGRRGRATRAQQHEELRGGRRRLSGSSAATTMSCGRKKEWG
jgi:hypothetical protein